MKTTVINVFRKERKSQNGTGFMTHSTKLGKNNTYYQVRFTSEFEENMKKRGIVYPSGKRPFTIEVEPHMVSSGTRKITVEGEEPYEVKVLYVNDIVKIGEYVEPDFDFENA